MDPTIKGVVIGGCIAAAASLLTQLVGHLLGERTRAADRDHERKLRFAEEVHRVAPAFVEAVYSLRLRLDQFVRLVTGSFDVEAPSEAASEAITSWKEKRMTELAEELDNDRATELNVRLWQVYVACSRDAAGTAEEVVERLRNYFTTVDWIEAAEPPLDSVGVSAVGEKCQNLSEEIERLLRQFAEEVRATGGEGDDLA